MRTQPKDAVYFAWTHFEAWANREGVGTEDVDWEPWWECWKVAYRAAVNER